MEVNEILNRLKKSPFRSRFHLTEQDKKYISEKGMATIERHARDFIKTRIAPAYPKNDGKQTPWRGHPVFTSQHATATCCRGCIEKWYHIPKGRELTKREEEMLESVMIAWIKNELK